MGFINSLFSCYEKNKNVMGGGGGRYSTIEYGPGSIEKLLYKVSLRSLNLIHKFKLNYLLIKPRKTICFHAMRPSKYQNNNTESLMGEAQTSYICFWIGPFFFLIGRHLFLQCFKFGKAMYIICNKIRVRMEGGPYSMGGGGQLLYSYYIQWGSIFNLTPALALAR